MQDNETIHPFSLLNHEYEKWIVGNINKLDENRARFCSTNAVRFLRCANAVFKTYPMVSSFCALNATEEAVAAFISAAKVHGHKVYASTVNLHDHRSKALISVFAQQCIDNIEPENLAISLHQESDHLFFHVPERNDGHGRELHLSSFSIDPSNGVFLLDDIPLGDVPSLEKLDAAAEEVAETRNKILYATDKGFPIGFVKLEASIAREIKLSLGLIWATVDMYMHPDQNRPFVEDVLEAIALVCKEKKNKKKS
ncbi:MAG: hypothetical protein JKY17_03785 [Magnetovibrio sp.]|nr:hypothetical protein [Magnetovibrio sp.]